jgi:AcrR family transcriptional regulator
MSSPGELFDADLIDAAIRAAEGCGKDVADVPLGAIAHSAGVSRSTLLRRLGGTRRALDEAVRAAGVDPGGRPVRVRAVEAGARLISSRGLATVTLEAVAAAAGCSVPSLYVVFGTRDELFAAIYEHYSPLNDLMQLCADPTADLEQTVADFYRTMFVSLTREPRVATAMLADLLGNPQGPTAQIFARYFPQALSGVGGWLQAQVHVGRIRDVPVQLLLQQLIGPLLAHLLMRSALPGVADHEAELERICSVFTSGFLRAVAVPGPQSALEKGTGHDED